VGQVKVLLTEDTDGELQLARDTEVKNEAYSSSAVLLDGGEGDEPLVVQTVYPAYRGALVVCSGGDDPAVKLTVIQAVAALTGLSRDRITVAKWQ
jgi:stage III sporulation protein AG